MDDAPEHTDRIEVNLFTDNHVGDERSQDRRKYSGNTGHGYGKCDVTFGHKGDYVGGGTAGAGAYQYNAGGQCRVQIKGNGQQVCQEGHYEILSAAADENIERAFQNQREVLQVQCGAHAEHYDTEHAAQNADAVYLTQYP